MESHEQAYEVPHQSNALRFWHFCPY